MLRKTCSMLVMLIAAFGLLLGTTGCDDWLYSDWGYSDWGYYDDSYYTSSPGYYYEYYDAFYD